MASVNKVILLGNLGKDPETRYLSSGTAVTEFSMATTETWKDDGGEKHEKTSWHSITCFGRLAEIAGEYLKKGRPVYIEGSIDYQEWEKDGVKHYRTKVKAERLQLLGGRDDGERRDSGDRNGQKREDRPRSQGGGRQEQTRKPIDDGELDRDVPF